MWNSIVSSQQDLKRVLRVVYWSGFSDDRLPLEKITLKKNTILKYLIGTRFVITAVSVRRPGTRVYIFYAPDGRSGVFFMFCLRASSVIRELSRRRGTAINNNGCRRATTIIIYNSRRWFVTVLKFACFVLEFRSRGSQWTTPFLLDEYRVRYSYFSET